MSQTVFIFGAGASRAAGAPVMNDFLDTAADLLANNAVGSFSKDYEVVFRARDELQKVYSKADLDIKNLEAVFGAFEMAELVGRLGDLPIEDIARLKQAMIRVIQKTLEVSMRFQVKKGRLEPEPRHSELAKAIYESISGQYPNGLAKFCFITFNYDLCLDHAFISQGFPIDYALEVGKSGGSIRVFKLHGSLNWGKCPGCNKVAAWDLNAFLRGRQWLFDGPGHLEVASNLNQFAHCPGSFVQTGPFIVPPTWNKMQYHAEVDSVWRSAAAQLGNVENIFVCGFSLPETDQFFKYLYALGSIGEAKLKRFWVFDPDPQVERRFRDMLGPVARARFEFFTQDFNWAVAKMKTVIK